MESHHEETIRELRARVVELEAIVRALKRAALKRPSAEAVEELEQRLPDAVAAHQLAEEERQEAKTALDAAKVFAQDHPTTAVQAAHEAAKKEYTKRRNKAAAAKRAITELQKKITAWTIYNEQLRELQDPEPEREEVVEDVAETPVSEPTSSIHDDEVDRFLDYLDNNNIDVNKRMDEALAHCGLVVNNKLTLRKVAFWIHWMRRHGVDHVSGPELARATPLSDRNIEREECIWEHFLTSLSDTQDNRRLSRATPKERKSRTQLQLERDVEAAMSVYDMAAKAVRERGPHPITFDEDDEEEEVVDELDEALENAAATLMDARLALKQYHKHLQTQQPGRKFRRVRNQIK